MSATSNTLYPSFYGEATEYLRGSWESLRGPFIVYGEIGSFYGGDLQFTGSCEVLRGVLKHLWDITRTAQYFRGPLQNLRGAFLIYGEVTNIFGDIQITWKFSRALLSLRGILTQTDRHTWCAFPMMGSALGPGGKFLLNLNNIYLNIYQLVTMIVTKRTKS